MHKQINIGWVVRHVQRIVGVTHQRDVFARGNQIESIGYKIGLELLVRCRVDRVREIPIHFAPRIHGDSKLNVKNQLLYAWQVLKLLRHKWFA